MITEMMDTGKPLPALPAGAAVTEMGAALDSAGTASIFGGGGQPFFSEGKSDRD
jgi:hypothetical protein